MMRSIGCMLQDAVRGAYAMVALAIERRPMASLAITALVVLPVVGFFECH